ncbi:hypothetical protein [Streptomyces sp. NPDC001020]
MGDTEPVGVAVVGAVLGVAGVDRLGDALTDGDVDVDGVGPALADADALAMGAPVDPVDVEADGSRDRDSSGTPARMPSGRASSRCGVSYESSPPANAAAAATATTAPAAASSTVRRRRRGSPSPGGTEAPGPSGTVSGRIVASRPGASFGARACRPRVSSGTAASGIVSSAAASRAARPGAVGTSVPVMVTGMST